MVNLDICFRTEYVIDQHRWEMGMRGIAEMVVAAEQDSRETPDVDHPLVSDTVPSPPDHSKVLEV